MAQSGLGSMSLPTPVTRNTLPTTTDLEMNHLNRDLYGSRMYHVVAGKVMSIERDIIPGASVGISPVLGGDYRFLKTDASGDFQTIYTRKVGYGNDFRVWLTVKKKGFQTAHELIDYSDFPKPVQLPITLRPEHPDRTLLSQQDLLSHLLPRLRSLGPSDGISVKSEKKYSKGVVEFVDKGRPDRALGDFADVVRRNPECAKCQTMLALAELDSGNWDGAARRVDSAVKLTTKNKTGGSPEAMVLAGVMESWMHHPQSAVPFLFHANRLEPKDGLVLQELGRAYLQLQQYELADAYLERSVADGAGAGARLLWVQALLGEHKVDEASKEIDRYLNGRAVKTMPLEVRMVWAEVQNSKQIKALYAKSHKGKKKRTRREVASIDYLHDSPRQLQLVGLEPAKSQDDLKTILAAVGKNVAALFHDFQDSTSLEKVRQQQLGRNGKVSNETVEKFRYLCLMPAESDVPGFTEHRQSVKPVWGAGDSLKQGYMLTSGFVSAALIFHPAFQSGSEFRYLGRQRMDGHETYLLAFAQIPMKAELVGSFQSGKNSAPPFQQGLAWIDTQNDQIVRLRTDLLKPLPGFRLSEERTQIDYQEVRFKQLVQGLWLPKVVTVTVNWHGKTLRNEHQYSDFKLFNVRAAERIRKPIRAKKLAEAQSKHE